MKINIAKILITGLCCIIPFTASANTEKPVNNKQPLSLEGLYPYNEKAFSYTINQGNGETVYIISREDIPCFINFRSMLMSMGTEKTVKVIPVISKIGYDKEKLEKNNYLLYFYVKAMKKEKIGFPLILTQKDNKIQTYEGCPEKENWTNIF